MSAWKADALPLGHTRNMRTDFTPTSLSGQVWFVYLPIRIPDQSSDPRCPILCLKFKSIVESLITILYTGFIIYRPITTAMTHLAWSIAVKRLASRIDSSPSQYSQRSRMRTFIILLTSFLGNKKSPPPKRRASELVAVRMITGCRWHEYLHPTPRCPTDALWEH